MHFSYGDERPGSGEPRGVDVVLRWRCGADGQRRVVTRRAVASWLSEREWRRRQLGHAQHLARVQIAERHRERLLLYFLYLFTEATTLVLKPS